MKSDIYNLNKTKITFFSFQYEDIVKPEFTRRERVFWEVTFERNESDSENDDWNRNENKIVFQLEDKNENIFARIFLKLSTGEVGPSLTDSKLCLGDFSICGGYSNLNGVYSTDSVLENIPTRNLIRREPNVGEIRPLFSDYDNKFSCFEIKTKEELTPRDSFIFGFIIKGIHTLQWANDNRHSLSNPKIKECGILRPIESL